MNKLTAAFASLAFLAPIAGAAVIAPPPLAFTADADPAARWNFAAPARGDVLIDFRISYSGLLGNNDFAVFWFGASGGPNIGLKANCGDATCSSDLFGRLRGGSLDTAAYLGHSDMLAQPASYRVFGRLYKSDAGGNYDRFALWLDPTAQEIAMLANPDALASGDSGLAAFSSIGMRTANLNGVTIRFDQVRIEAVPEPGSLALVGLAFAGLLAARRRG